MRYALMELVIDVDGNAVLVYLTFNISNYYSVMIQRGITVELADYLAKRLDERRPEEASTAWVLYELVRHQKLG